MVTGPKVLMFQSLSHLTGPALYTSIGEHFLDICNKFHPKPCAQRQAVPHSLARCSLWNVLSLYYGDHISSLISTTSVAPPPQNVELPVLPSLTPWPGPLGPLDHRSFPTVWEERQSLTLPRFHKLSICFTADNQDMKSNIRTYFPHFLLLSPEMAQLSKMCGCWRIINAIGIHVSSMNKDEHILVHFPVVLSCFCVLFSFCSQKKLPWMRRRWAWMKEMSMNWLVLAGLSSHSQYT